MELWWNWVLSHCKVEQICLYLQVISRWNNLEGANRRASTILVHITCLYQSDGKFFMLPIILHQAKKYSQYIHFVIQLDWIFHHTPSGYMDIDGWIKAMTQLSTVCGASTIKNQMIYFNWHDIHFDYRALCYMEDQNIQPFALKSGHSLNDQTNNNGNNAKLKSRYNDSKVSWMLKYGTTIFLTRHMKSILVQAWNAFIVTTINIIIGRVLLNCVTKTDIFGGSYDIYICVILNSLWISVPRV